MRLVRSSNGIVHDADCPFQGDADPLGRPRFGPWSLRRAVRAGRARVCKRCLGRLAGMAP